MSKLFFGIGLMFIALGTIIITHWGAVIMLGAVLPFRICFGVPLIISGIAAIVAAIKASLTPGS